MQNGQEPNGEGRDEKSGIGVSVTTQRTERPEHYPHRVYSWGAMTLLK
jgi:hypothetical protein